MPWTAGRDVEWDDLLAAGDPARPHAVVDTEHVLMVAYTSGTTGRPKGAVHVHAGFLAKISQEAWFQGDLKDGDVLHWVTDMGWIMGPWATIGAHATGNTLALFDGAPDFPDPRPAVALRRRPPRGVPRRLADPDPRPAAARRRAPARPPTSRSLRAFGSTGEPWNPEPWRWLFDEVGEGRRPIDQLLRRHRRSAPACWPPTWR